MYIHTNIANGKRYVGITKREPNARWQNGEGYYKNKHFYSSIKKYGWDGFSHEIFIDGVTESQACSIEISLIKLLRSRNPDYGYNTESGGNYHSGELSIRRRVVQATADLKFVSAYESIEDAHRVSGVARSNICDSCSGKTTKGKKWKWFYFEDLCKNYALISTWPIDQYTPLGDFVATFRDVDDAVRSTGVAKHGVISCIKGELKTSHGYQWVPCFKRMDVGPVTRKPDKRTVGRASVPQKTIYRYTKHGELIAEYASIKEVSEWDASIGKNVSRCLSGKSKQCGGYVWKISTDDIAGMGGVAI